MAMTGPGRLSTSSTRATDFSRPTSNGATAPGNSTAFRIGRTGRSSPNWMSSSERGGKGGGGFFLSDMGSPWCGAPSTALLTGQYDVRLIIFEASTDFRKLSTHLQPRQVSDRCHAVRGRPRRGPCTYLLFKATRVTGASVGGARISGIDAIVGRVRPVGERSAVRLGCRRKDWAKRET